MRTVKTFVMRSGRITAAQKRNYAELHDKWCIPYNELHIEFEAVFKNKNPVIMEIGFGMGSATAIIAKQNPCKNYLGVEVFKAGVGKLLGEIENKKLSNVRIIEYDAVDVLANMIPDGTLAGFHIFFPDPWQKKRNHKRRLIRRPRTDLLALKLKPGGYIYAVTDWADYAEDAYRQLSNTPYLISKYEHFNEKQIFRPVTKFEQKGLKKGHIIRELFFEKAE